MAINWWRWLFRLRWIRKSEFFLAALLIYQNDETFWNFPTETQNFIIWQIIKYNKDNDESKVSFTQKKVLMELKDTQVLSLNKLFISGWI